MFNLLPNNLKDKIRSEYRLHFVIVAFLFIIFLQVTHLVFLFPSWLISLNKEKEVILQSEKSNRSSLDSQINLINSTIKSINTKLNVINSTLEYPKVVPLIDGILAQKTNDIHIKAIQYTSSKNTSVKINLTGVSATRESLVLFVKKLEESKLFNNVDLPISNFTKDKDIDFSINMTITP